MEDVFECLNGEIDTFTWQEHEQTETEINWTDSLTRYPNAWPHDRHWNTSPE